MLTLTKLKGAEYVISSVAAGVEDYYMGAGEAPGVWQGEWASELGLEGVVEADDLRALVDGLDLATGKELLAGHRERKVRAIDVTLSVPKSVSLLWAFGTEETSAVVSIAVVEATNRAVGFLEERAAFARQQQGGVRRRVGTDGFAVATFAHRTSRAGDPQLHTHCLIPNVVRRADGVHVAFDANPLHTWAKAAGAVFLNELERSLTDQLGVAWGPDRNGSREMVGFTREQLRTFSKRTVAIEAHLEAAGEVSFDSKRERMKADDWASVKTRAGKDKTVTPEVLRERWDSEAAAVGLDVGAGVDNLVVGRQLDTPSLVRDREVFAALVDPHTGLCATESRFCEAHVVERVAAISAGRMSTAEIVAMSRRFLATDLLVRLTPDAARRRPPEWSTVELRAVEDRLLGRVRDLRHRPCPAIPDPVIKAVVAAEPKPLGPDQRDAVSVLCGPGGSLRALIAPAGHGKTTALHAAVAAQVDASRTVVVLAPTHKAVAELRAAGLEAQTVARFLLALENAPLAEGSTVLVDEFSQLATRPAAKLFEAVADTPGCQLWCVGDPVQGQPVAAGGLAAELDRLVAADEVVWASLSQNRRQHHPADREALAKLRAGDIDANVTIRTGHGWEHECASAAETRATLAQTAVADADRHGPDQVAVLAVSHADCEDLTDRIRTIRAQRGELRGPTLRGPAWGPDERVYAAGDRILLHVTLTTGPNPAVFNGATGTITGVTNEGARVLFDHGQELAVPTKVFAGVRHDGTPAVSHAWARTVESSQGGTWTQVHLLGTPALDRFSGYVGQSRGREPTHTWNTRPDADHPLRLLADQRTPIETVNDAMRRAEPKTLAALDDPWILDRQLRAERQEHAAIIAARPHDPGAHLDRARDHLARTDRDHATAVKNLAWKEKQRAQLGPLHKIRPGGRQDIDRADSAVSAARTHLARQDQHRSSALGNVQTLENARTENQAWEQDNGWRPDRIAAIDDALVRHWADVALQSVRADDPLAFGIKTLRLANSIYQGDLNELVTSLPPDRRDALKDAETKLHHRENNLQYANRNVGKAEREVGRAGQRRFGMRDKPAISEANQGLRDAEGERDAAADAVSTATGSVAAERHAVNEFTTATKEVAPERERLTVAVNDLTGALNITRAERVAAALNDPTHELWDTLGPPPQTSGGRNAWCGIAERLELWRDQPPTGNEWIDEMLGEPTHPVLGRRPGIETRREFNELAHLIDHAPEIINEASRHDPTPAPKYLDPAEWRNTVEASHDLNIEPPAPGIDRSHSFGIEL